MTPEKALFIYISISYALSAILTFQSLVRRKDYMSLVDKCILVGMPLVPIFVVLLLIADTFTYLFDKLKWRL